MEGEAPKKKKEVPVRPRLIKRAAAHRGDSEWLTLFRMLDPDGDGKIEVEEFRTAVLNSAEVWGIQRDMAEQLLEDVDKNRDGQVDFGEFCLMMAKAQKLKMRRAVLYAAEWVTLKGRADKQTRYLLQYSCLPPPLFILLITAMQVTGYFIYACQEDKFEATGPVPFKSIFILNPHQRDSQFWRYITYMFVHIGYSHLIGNVVMQLLIGVPLEMVHKFWRIGALYTAGVITGALLMSAADSGTYLGGASGGVYTLIAAHISNVAINWGEMDFNWIRAIVIGIFVLLDGGMALYQRIWGGENKVSHTAHIGGFVAGLLLGIVLLRNLRLKRWEQIAWGVCLGLFFVFAAVLLGLVYYPLLFAPAPPAS